MSASPETLLLLERRVKRLGESRPELEQAAALQEALIRELLTAESEPRVEPFPLPRERVVAKVTEGTPLLHGEPAYVDVYYASDLFSRLVNVAQERIGDVAAEVGYGRLTEAATRGALPPEQLFTEAFVQHREHLAQLALSADVDADLLATLATLSVAPLLRAYGARLLPLLEQVIDASLDGVQWTRGYCPICGAWPSMAELRGVALKRHLRCSACASAWAAPRLACPYCGNDDFKQLSYLRPEGEPRFRVEVCSRCNGYLKTANAFDQTPPELAALDDLASIHLDVAAIERDYQRPSGTGFTLELALMESEWSEDLASLS